MLTLGLVCADRDLRPRAVHALTQLQALQLSWFVNSAGQVQGQRPVPLLLVAAEQCSQQDLARWSAAGRVQVLALASTLERDCDAVYAALDAGASGYLELDRHLGADALEQQLLHLRRLYRSTTQATSALPPLLAIGASAGGPAALRQVLGALPAGLPAAVLIVQHFEGADIQGFCDWLRPALQLPVHAALADSVPRAGEILVAQSGAHLQLDAGQRLQCPLRQPGELLCPSVDRLFHSLVQHAPAGVAMLLTGMGQDGAAGLLALRAARWHTLVQDAASSAVDGMPRAARELDAACQVLDLAQLAPHACAALSKLLP